MSKIPSITEVINSSERPDYSAYRLSRTDAIKRYCLDCMGFYPSEVVACTDKKCALWRYRQGKEVNDELNPGKQFTEEQRKATSERLKRMHQQKALESAL